jgi:hypothetical protein
MKKLFLASILFSLAAVSAQASELQVRSLESTIENASFAANFGDSNSGNNAENKFQTLVDLANQGRPAVFNETIGVYVGRCYDMKNINMPRNSILLVEEMPSQDGPLFPTNKVVIEGGHPNQDADYYDNQSKETLRNAVLGLASSYANVSEYPLSVQMIVSNTESHTINYFKNQDYIISLDISNQDIKIQVRGNGELEVKKGDTWAACYYFLKK